MGCYVVAEFLLTSVSRGPSAIAEPLVLGELFSNYTPTGEKTQHPVDDHFIDLSRSVIFLFTSVTA